MESVRGGTMQIVLDAPVLTQDVAKGQPALNADHGLSMEDVIRRATAAVEVQKIFRGYRVRRNIADAATMAHKFGWWHVVECAVLQYQSSSFYAYKSPQSASQRWLRLEKKAAKLGKGLSKNKKARQLALQHWLEAIDPKHRYGHNLHFYYEIWSKSETHEPFFYWLDIGDGKDVDVEECNRSKLQKEQIRYLSPAEREWFEVVIIDGKLRGKLTGDFIDTPKGEKWIFVMSTTGKFYVGKKERGRLQHSSFLAGGATTAAGRLLVRDGVLELLEAHSGHYHPTSENFIELVGVLKSKGADLTCAKVQFVSDDMLCTKSKSSKSLTATSETSPREFPGTSDDGQKQDCNDERTSVNEVASLNLEDEPSPSCVDEVTLLEKTGPPEAHANRDVVIEGLESIHMHDSEIWEQREGLKVEIIEPGETSQLENQEPVDGEHSPPFGNYGRKSFSRLPPTSSSFHKLFTPALQTLTKLEDRTGSWSAGLSDVKAEKSAELHPNSKEFLLSRLSFKDPVPE